MQRQRRLRVVLIGDFGVGKTSLLRQFCEGTFLATPSNTIQEDEREATAKVGGSEEVPLLITDTAGQEQFRSFTSSYFRDKDGYVVVFDVTSRESFANLGHWIKEIRSWDDQYQVCVVANKVDLKDLRQVSTKEGEDFVESIGQGATYVETSAKLNINCALVFEKIARLCRHRRSSLTSSTTVQLNENEPAEEGRQNFACPCN